MRLFLLVLLCFLSFNTMAQSPAIYEIENSNVEHVEEIHQLILDNEVTASYQFIDVDLDQLKDSPSININFFDLNEDVFRDRLETRSDTSFSWFGVNADSSMEVIISVLGNTVDALIVDKEQDYLIQTFYNQPVVQIMDENIELVCGFPDHGENVGLIDETEVLDAIERGENNGCTVDILVMYTEGASIRANHNIHALYNSIQLSEDILNQSFRNSAINGKVRIVHVAYAGNYSETYGDFNYWVEKKTSDLWRFKVNTPTDSYMNHVHTLRDQYGADLCILLSGHAAVGLSGLAFSSVADKHQAFAEVDIRVMNVYRTFAHEVGHLIGAMHQIAYTRWDTTFPYAHAFQSKEFTSIMYRGSAKDVRSRKNYFSNPYIYYNGIQTGTFAYSYNAKLLNDNISRVMYHRPAQGIKYVGQPDVAINWVKSIYGPDIVTTGIVEIKYGRNYTLRGENSVTLNAGFQTHSNSQFIAYVDQCGERWIGPENFWDNNSSNKRSSDKIEDVEKSHNIKIYPTPVQNDLNIKNLNQDNRILSVQLYSIEGKLLKRVDKNEILENQNLSINVSDIPNGMYILYLESLFENFSFKMVKSE